MSFFGECIGTAGFYVQNLPGMIFGGDRLSVDKDEDTGSIFYRKFNDKNHTREIREDKDADGNIDSVSYFQDDENRKCQQSQFDRNNDGKIDETQKFSYEDGSLSGRYTYRGDGTDDKPISFTDFKGHKFHYQYDASGKTTDADFNNNGIIDARTRTGLDDKITSREIDIDEDGEFDRKENYVYDSSNSNLLGKYINEKDENGITTISYMDMEAME